METQKSVAFPPFRLELSSEQLWCDNQAIALRPKTFAVLRYLVEHGGQLVTKDELLDAVWAGTVVGDTVLKSCIGELRQALGDDVQKPQYIATVHRRGYRFIGPLTTTLPAVSYQSSVLSKQKPTRPPQTTEHWQLTRHLVGRESELVQLHRWLEKALDGVRQIVFLTGEAGIGKTTLVDMFLSQLDGQPQWIGRGQCIEQYGAGEAYMPILEALGRLCREPGGERLIAFLHQYAPTWLVQMPMLLNAVELEALQRKVQGATRERMLREMAEAVDALSAEQPLVLWLEDLHWSDASTLELLALLARRREPARLLVLGTYRPVDVIVKEHPLRAVKQELQLHGHCEELALRFLTEAAVEAYLAGRFAADGGTRCAVPLQQLAHTIHQRTEGNPLFMVNVVEELLTQGMVDSAAVEMSTPASIQQLIERYLERLSVEEQHVLEVASVAGMNFSAAAVAAGAEATVEEVEECCTELARRGNFLRAKEIEEWPDGTVATRYGFLHALYQEVTYKRVPAGRRARLHLRIGEREEAAYGQQAGEIAAELARHFEQGRDYRRTVQYLHQAGKNVLRRSAYQEAVAHLTKALELLNTLPDTPERLQQELTLQLVLIDTLAALKSYAAPEVEQSLTRVQELCHQLGKTPQLFPALFRLFSFYFTRGELQTTRELAEQLMCLAQSAQDRHLLSVAHFALGCTLCTLGELAPAWPHLEQAIALYDFRQHPNPSANVPNALVSYFSYASYTLWGLGYPDQALQRSQEAVALAEELVHPFSLAYTLWFAAMFHLFRREEQSAREQAEAVTSLSIEQGFPFWLAGGRTVRGGALAEQGQVEEGITQMQQGLAALRTMGTELVRTPCLSWLAAAYAKVERVEEGLAVIAEALALVHKTGQRASEAELYRLKGELMLQQCQVSRFNKPKGKRENQFTVHGSRSQSLHSQSVTVDPQAEVYFLKAIDIARCQHAKSWELRATMSLVRLWQQQGKKKKAHKLLSKIYGWFTEGFDTKDLQEAKALLEELA